MELQKVITDITESKEKMYEITPVKGIPYTVAKNHIIILKTPNFTSIVWNDKEQRYRVMLCTNKIYY